MTSTPSNSPKFGRSRGEISIDSAHEAIDAFYEKRERGEAATTADGDVTNAQFNLLEAIYYELRHGHDQTAAHAAAIEKQTKVMADLAGVMDRVALHLGNR